ncbi:hypothetical protein MRX96_038141 [Rhipicephalus microplus]
MRTRSLESAQPLLIPATTIITGARSRTYLEQQVRPPDSLGHCRHACRKPCIWTASWTKKKSQRGFPRIRGAKTASKEERSTRVPESSLPCVDRNGSPREEKALRLRPCRAGETAVAGVSPHPRKR